MSTGSITEKEIKIVTYAGKDFTIQTASNWKAQQLSENQTAFFGPKVGKLKLGFYITAMPKKGKNYLEAANLSKKTQSKQKEYNILEEKDISQGNSKAFMRRSSWYNADKDITLFVREIFTETDHKVFILSSSIPNSPQLAELDNAIVAMMNSFRFKKQAQLN